MHVFVWYVFYSSPEMVRASQITYIYMLFGKLTDLFVRYICIKCVIFILHVL